MGEGALHRLAHKGVGILVLVAELVKAAGRSPESLVRRCEIVAYNLDFLAGGKIIDDCLSALQGINVIFGPVRMDVHRFGRIDVRIQRSGIPVIELLLSVYESNLDLVGRE